ncbi:MAG: DUF4234 domain-containing protein [Candidatus Electrothrix sp. AS4_5]|nr:DUF4234 domain-containing protein [Candidatus Electrothrix gigas]
MPAATNAPLLPIKVNIMQPLNSLTQLQDQGTFKLLVLSSLTCGVYGAYYMKRQTATINRLIDQEHNISERFVNILLVSSYLSFIFLVSSLLVDKGHSIEKISNVLVLTFEFMAIIWTFKAGNRLNAFYEIPSSDIVSFDRCWMFLFGIFYFNYHINQLIEYDIGFDKLE